MNVRSAIALAVLLCTPCLAVGQAAQDNEPERIKSAVSQAQGIALAFHAAAEKMKPSVVTILAKRQDVDETLDAIDLLDDNSRADFDIGSGVIISETGLCVTNHHVIKDAKSIRVRLPDGRAFAGEDVRSDASSDLAVFRIADQGPFPAATMGNSDVLNVGDWVLAIGSPFALDQTVSVGIISSKGRLMNKKIQGQLLQTDATINPGNSGGALLDIHGDLVGINTLISTTSGQFQGVSFAIPVTRVQWIVKELTEFGKVRRSLLGMKADRIPQAVAAELKISPLGGVYVTRVTPNLPAENGGIMMGDVVLELADQRVQSPGDFGRVAEQLQTDRAYPIKILRDGTPMTLEVRPIARSD